ncbi:hypothetical protein AAG570_004459 [Ranatra chinensis]|uniref:Uncharacterized protein n=1 Tax=Ranatra chinensis TaxID=642074 RepID=A0ABD0Y0Z2_9HEMI
MASKRRNMFHKNKTQETTEEARESRYEKSTAEDDGWVSCFMKWYHCDESCGAGDLNRSQSKRRQTTVPLGRWWRRWRDVVFALWLLRPVVVMLDLVVMLELMLELVVMLGGLMLLGLVVDQRPSVVPTGVCSVGVNLAAVVQSPFRSHGTSGSFHTYWRLGPETILGGTWTVITVPKRPRSRPQHHHNPGPADNIPLYEPLKASGRLGEVVFFLGPVVLFGYSEEVDARTREVAGVLADGGVPRDVDLEGAGHVTTPGARSPSTCRRHVAAPPPPSARQTRATRLGESADRLRHSTRYQTDLKAQTTTLMSYKSLDLILDDRGGVEAPKNSTREIMAS